MAKIIFLGLDGSDRATEILANSLQQRGHDTEVLVHPNHIWEKISNSDLLVIWGDGKSLVKMLYNILKKSQTIKILYLHTNKRLAPKFSCDRFHTLPVAEKKSIVINLILEILEK